MDISKAFDSIPHALLLVKLKGYGLGETSIELLRNYLCARIQYVKIRDKFSEWELVRRGVSQGSALSPIFFNVDIKDFFYQIKQGNLNTYADDDQLYRSINDLETLNTLLEHELGTVKSWYEQNGMIVIPDKHQAMVLSANIILRIPLIHWV